jgi:hypothetical protein
MMKKLTFLLVIAVLAMAGVSQAMVFEDFSEYPSGHQDNVVYYAGGVHGASQGFTTSGWVDIDDGVGKSGEIDESGYWGAAFSINGQSGYSYTGDGASQKDFTTEASVPMGNGTIIEFLFRSETAAQNHWVGLSTDDSNSLQYNVRTRLFNDGASAVGVDIWDGTNWTTMLAGTWGASSDELDKFELELDFTNQQVRVHLTDLIADGGSADDGVRSSSAWFAAPNLGTAADMLANGALQFQGSKVSGMMGNLVVDDIEIVPEPATMVLLGLGGLGMLRRRRA